ncbi:MAG: hypothetical protein K0Q69_363 [Devosia sp.]|jgi:hypothetical protein|nr:hypothetical protein [Devosia sp.]
MNDLDHREQAQLGLKYIEDSVVNLLTRHPKGLSSSAIAEVLGLSADLEPKHRDMIASGILELLVRSGRILWDQASHTYVDNPDRS